MTTSIQATLLRHRLQGITDPAAIMRIIAAEIMECYPRANAMKIAGLLIDTAEIDAAEAEVRP